VAPVRVGLVGSRFAAHLHLGAYRRVYGVDARLVAVTSPTAERREAFARETGATAWASLAAMLPHVDVVDVCSPPATHEPVALEAIDAGKHVVIEKPFTGAFDKGAGAEALLKQALASAERITAAARRRGVVLAYAENWVYAPAIQKEREIIEKTGAQVLWMIGRIRPSTGSGSTPAAARSWARAAIP
jgi:predicted dehydrogenase